MKYLVFVLAIAVASYGVASDPTADQPTSKAVARANSMKQAVRHFSLHLTFRGETDKPFYNLILSVNGGWRQGGPFDRHARITVEQAKTIIDLLATNGFFDRAKPAERFKAPENTGYILRVAVDDNGDKEDIGWGLPMLERLDGLRRVLDGDAAKNMDVLLERLSGYRKEWEKDGAKAEPADANKRTPR